MADEFQAEVCGGTWWNSRSMFGSSPCSSGILDLGSFGWPADFLDIKTRSISDESNKYSASDGSIVIQGLQKPSQRQDSGSRNSSISLDSTLQIMGIGLSSTTTDWDRGLISGNGRLDQNNNYLPIFQQDQNSGMNYQQESGVEDCPDEIQKGWSTLKNNFSTIADDPDSSINSFKSFGNQPLTSISSSGQCTTTFPINSVSYGYSSSLLQTVFDAVPQPQPHQQALYANRSMNYPSSTNYQTSLTELASSLPKFSPSPKLQHPPQFSASPNICNGSAATLNDFRASFFPTKQSQFLPPTFNEKVNLPSLKAKANNDEVQGSVAKKTGSEPALKRLRIETPSPLPTFKVRKEKLGDRITALQQLVSPFGKTDTASVLHEAIEYIKFYHDQVTVLSTPYMKNGSPIHRQQTTDKVKDQEGSKENLRSRGLCLVPISSTFPVAAETTTDFWSPTFGSTFR